MQPKIPKRFYAGSRPRRLRFPETQIHVCTVCGTHFFDPQQPCRKIDRRNVAHRALEFCSRACRRYWPYIAPQEVA